MEQDSEILIISDESEKSTDQVLKYLLYYDAKFIRINGSDIIEKIEIIFDEKEEIQLVCKDVELNFNKVKSSWYRRGKINLLPVGHYQKMNGDEMQFYGQYLEHYGKELKGILTFIHNSLKSRKQINSIHDNDISKLSQLSLAKSCGLKIPFTIFSNNIENILKQYEPNIFIVKAINFHVFRLNVNNCKWIWR
ncbi:MAG: hypothetical protein IPJ31_02805 [Bacteroidetes bacterium]|nr:hypothetical protein [Bacteroidota bacterium]